MSEIIAIDNNIKNPYSFEVTWDLGLRCNFDCTYCPSHRHNNTSPHASLETLIKTSKFVFDYKKLLQSYMTYKRKWNIGFTGGEPTNNPNFLDMCEYIHNQNDDDVIVDVTTNGAMSEKYCTKLIDNVDSVTVSYHCEADQKIKNKVIDRIYQLKDSNVRHKVNLMFHAKEEYFNECIDLVGKFTRDNVKFVPRIIGESYENDKYNHRYTPEQHKWFREFWAIRNKKENNQKQPKKIDENNDAEYEYKDDQEKVQKQKAKVEPKKDEGRKSLGRPCCGQRTFYTLTDDHYNNNNKELDTDKWNPSVFACSTEYKDWSCLINWNWLHIEQEYDNILHHQTCRANFGGKRGPIGKISESEKVLLRLEKQLATGKMPVITCPNKICGCGLCVQKSKHNDMTEAMFNKAVKGLTPVIGAELNE
tara:strand:+ start:3739 stop:4995 length:1257 start_codon:yes stop_codon:yes gene_type:complete